MTEVPEVPKPVSTDLMAYASHHLDQAATLSRADCGSAQMTQYHLDLAIALIKQAREAAWEEQTAD